MRRFALGLLTLVFAVHFPLLAVSHAERIPKRIISLAPNMTELLFAMGLGDRVVGVTTFCDFPEETKKRPKIGGMSNPSLEAVVSLKPDMVVMTMDGNPKEFEQKLRSLKIKTYVFKALQIGEFPQAIREMGYALGGGEKADRLADEVSNAVNKFKIQNSKFKKKVLFIVSPEPLIVAGHGSIPDNAITILGAENIAANSKTAYPKFSIEEVLRLAPDIIFIGRGEGMKDMSAGLLRRLRNVPAVKNSKVFYVGDYLFRLTPRTTKGIEELAGYLEK